MTEHPTIEDVAMPEYWRSTLLCSHDSQMEFASVLSASTALRAVLRELDQTTNGRSAFDIAMATVSLRERIRAALGEEGKS